MDFDVFLSHQGMDKEKVIKLADYLEPEITCWYAPRNIPSGKENYGSAILDAVEECKVFLVLLTENFELDPENHIINEVFHARKHRKKIIPLLIGRTEYPRELELHLNSHQWMYQESLTDDVLPEIEHAICNLLYDDEDEMSEQTFYARTKNQSKRVPEGFTPVSTQVIDKYQHVYMPTVSFHSISKKTPIISFYGKHEQEKTTQALNYFLHLDKEHCFEGLSADALQALKKDTIEENACYLIHSDASEVEKILTDTFLNYLEENLIEKNASLILCTDIPLRQLSASYLISLPDDKKEYVWKRLTWELSDEDEQKKAKELLNDIADEVHLHEIEREESFNELVEEIKESIHDVDKQKQLIHTARFIHSNTFPLPFDLEKDDNIIDILYNLAISLRHGKSYDVIAETYDELVNVFQNFYPEQEVSHRKRALSALVRDYDLQLKRVEAHNMLGAYDDTAIYYSYDVVQKRIWSVIWREYPYQPFLAHVLMTYMNDRDDSVRKQAEKIALSIFHDYFEQAIEYLLFPLAKSKQLGDKLLVRRLLVQLYENMRFKLKIMRLLKNWLHVPNADLEQTALITLQSKIGIENYRDAFSWVLMVLYKNKETSNTLYITYSYLNKYIYVQPDLEKVYYDMLREKLIAWRDEEVFEPFIRLLLDFMQNNSAMYFQSRSPFVLSFFVYLLSFFILKSQLQLSANALRQYLFDLQAYESGKEQYRAILQDLKNKLSARDFHALIETMKKGDAS